jgi:hypothetical protein
MVMLPTALLLTLWLVITVTLKMTLLAERVLYSSWQAVTMLLAMNWLRNLPCRVSQMVKDLRMSFNRVLPKSTQKPIPSKIHTRVMSHSWMSLLSQLYLLTAHRAATSAVLVGTSTECRD